MLLAAQVNGFVLLVFAFAVLTTVIAFRSVRRAGAGAVSRPATRPRLEQPVDRGHHLSAPDEFRRWEVEMHTLGREMQARLDNKIAILERLLIEAAQESARLERLLAESGRSQLAAPHHVT